MLTALALAGCEDTLKNPFGALAPARAEGAQRSADGSVRIVERDVEAPEVFQVTEDGLWDGRPSLGGVWVAHPAVKDPERVIIRNEATGSFVIGALFRRQREGAGPPLQVSSDAAEALGLVAGQPTRLDVTVLRREQVADAPEPEAAPAAGDEAEAPPEAAAETDTQPSEAVPAAIPPAPEATITAKPLAAAAAALDRADAAAAEAARNPAAPAASPTPHRRPAVSELEKPYLQVGLFSVAENAEATGERLRANGILPTIREQTSRDKTFWRVLVGPVTSRAERRQMLEQLQGLGYADAYAVSD